MYYYIYFLHMIYIYITYDIFLYIYICIYIYIHMLPDFRGNLRGTSGNRPDMQFMNILDNKNFRGWILHGFRGHWRPRKCYQKQLKSNLDFSSINFVQFGSLRASIQFTTKMNRATSWSQTGPNCRKQPQKRPGNM